ncbi:hypothetical protein Cgig2_010519 [Carnegiea gigantea]|uniref:Pectinesterase inhibitor domain-containing protein n=1 Tax=Carnegiea gigantea TaxID=171969 RepID=A0A9Q1QND4_9CARY|nr:hypothetical protein Cgig2_010519 [Carnegiea gigantea]
MPPFHHLLLLLLYFSLLLSPSLSTRSGPIPDSNDNNNNNNKYISFIKSACNATTYPTLCLKTCLPYASKIKGSTQKLVVTALSATLTAAESSAATVTALSRRSSLDKYEAAAIRDCIDNMGDSIDELKQSIQEISDDDLRSSSEDLKFKIANVQTWMSAAITDEDTCMDGIDDRNVDPDVKRKIRGSILGVAKLTILIMRGWPTS